MEALMMVLVAAVGGALVMPVMQGLKKVSSFIDGLPDILKQMIVAGLAVAATKLAVLTGYSIPSDVLSMNGTTVQSLLTAAFAFLAHHLFKSKTA